MGTYVPYRHLQAFPSNKCSAHTWGKAKRLTQHGPLIQWQRPARPTSSAPGCPQVAWPGAFFRAVMVDCLSRSHLRETAHSTTTIDSACTKIRSTSTCVSGGTGKTCCKLSPRSTAVSRDEAQEQLRAAPSKEVARWPARPDKHGRRVLSSIAQARPSSSSSYPHSGGQTPVSSTSSHALPPAWWTRRRMLGGAMTSGDIASKYD